MNTVNESTIDSNLPYEHGTSDIIEIDSKTFERMKYPKDDRGFFDRAKKFLSELKLLQKKYHVTIGAGGTGGEETTIVDENDSDLEVSASDIE